MDGRRRRYVPLDAMVAFGRFGTRLVDKWGLEGIGTWALFLAACKREAVQGTFTYTTDEDGWGKLGARAEGFTLDEFWRFTGQQKKTAKHRHGRITYVVCTVWPKWNKPAQRPFRDPSETLHTPLRDGPHTSQTPLRHLSDTIHTHLETAQTGSEGGENPRKEAQNTEDLENNAKNYKPDASLARADLDLDLEVEGEVEVKSISSVILDIYDYWRLKRQKTRSNYDRMSPARAAKIRSRLTEFAAADLKAAIDGVGRDPWGERASHDDLTVIFRSREQVEKFLDLAGAARNGSAALTPFEATKAWVMSAGWQYEDADLIEELGRRGLEGDERKRLAALALQLQEAAT